MLFQFYPYAGRGLWQTLVDWGFIDALLPFILIFVLLFAILQKIGLFKDDKGQPDRRINGVLALIISAMVVAPHVVGLYPPQADPIIMINLFLPNAVMLLVAILCVILLLGLAGGAIPSLLLWAIALVALGLLLITVLIAVVPGFFPTFGFLSNPSTQALIIILVTMGLIGYFVMREPESAPGFGDWVKKWLGEIK